MEFKPKIALNESDLLGGFMAEFGLSTNKGSHQREIVAHETNQKLTDDLLSVDFGSSQPRNAQNTNTESTFESKNLLKAELTKRVEKLLSVSEGESSEDFRKYSV